MGGGKELIRVASSDMVRKKLQNHPMHLPAGGSDQFAGLLKRLSETEDNSANSGGPDSSLRDV
jgi:hypothetical protein